MTRIQSTRKTTTMFCPAVGWSPRSNFPWGSRSHGWDFFFVVTCKSSRSPTMNVTPVTRAASQRLCFRRNLRKHNKHDYDENVSLLPYAHKTENHPDVESERYVTLRYLKCFRFLCNSTSSIHPLSRVYPRTLKTKHDFM